MLFSSVPERFTSPHLIPLTQQRLPRIQAELLKSPVLSSVHFSDAKSVTAACRIALSLSVQAWNSCKRAVSTPGANAQGHTRSQLGIVLSLHVFICPGRSTPCPRRHECSHRMCLAT